MAEKRGSAESSPEQVVQEFALVSSPDDRIPDRWELQRSDITIGEKKVFAPANLRAAAENPAYAQLIQQWMSSKYTLRYTGGMVPDIHHIVTKACFSQLARRSQRHGGFQFVRF